MSTADESRFREACALVSRHVHDRYGVTVEEAEMKPPFKGDLDGRSIYVGSGSAPDERLFLVAHLFGHTVQWNVSAALRHLGMRMPVDPDASLLDALEAYEREACGYSQQAMHEAGISDLDQWLADHSACDLAYLRDFYLTGQRKPFRSFWRAGQPPIAPLPIPPFTPTRWRRRTAAIVI